MNFNRYPSVPSVTGTLSTVAVAAVLSTLTALIAPVPPVLVPAATSASVAISTLPATVVLASAVHVSPTSAQAQPIYC